MTEVGIWSGWEKAGFPEHPSGAGEQLLGSESIFVSFFPDGLPSPPSQKGGCAA